MISSCYLTSSLVFFTKSFLKSFKRSAQDFCLLLCCASLFISSPSWSSDDKDPREETLSCKKLPQLHKNNKGQSEIEVEKTPEILLLSIDGGGYRGLIPACVLEKLENALSEKHGYEVFIAQHIDGIAGASTGSIIAGGLVVRHPLYSGYPKYQASEFPNLYTDNGKDIFSNVGKSWLEWFQSIKGIGGPKYSRDPLDALLDTHFKEATLEEGLLRKEEEGDPIFFFVPSYNISTASTCYFHNFSFSDTAKFKIKDLVGASTAAPTYFPAKEIPEGSNTYYIDGGVFRNNPASAFTLNMQKQYPGKKITMVSLGTGKVEKFFPELQNAGICRIGSIVEVFMAASQQEADDVMRLLPNTSYIRIQPILQEATLDAVDPETTQKLKDVATEIWEKSENYTCMYNAFSSVCKAKGKALAEAITRVDRKSHTITLKNWPILSGDTYIEALLQHITSNLTSLTLTNCNIWGQSDIKTPLPSDENSYRKKLTVQRLCAALKVCKALQEIDLSRNRVGDGGLFCLATTAKAKEGGSLILPVLETLILQDNGLSLAGSYNIKQLIFKEDGTRNNALKKLDLCKNSRMNAQDLKNEFEQDVALQLTNVSFDVSENTMEFFRGSNNPLTLTLGD